MPTISWRPERHADKPHVPRNKPAFSIETLIDFDFYQG
jgi:hypothetical protein